MERIPIVRPALVAGIAGLTAIALTVFVRRAAGAALGDLAPGEAAVYAAAFAAAVFAAVDTLSSAFRPRRPFTASVATLFLALVFSAGLSADPRTIFLCVPVAALVAFGLAASRAADLSWQAGSGAKESPPAGIPERPSASVPNGGVDEGSRLRLERFRRDGRERIEGLIRFEIPPTEAVANLHVPLWPPCEAVPSVRCTLEGLDGRVRIAASKPYGFRIEIRIPEPLDEPATGVVRFAGECATARKAAA